MNNHITYSPAYTLVPTYECFNRCTYCNFRLEPHQSPWLSLSGARQTLETLKERSVIEILILSGEIHPRSPRREAWVERVYALGLLALSMGFLPHTNVGPLSRVEMEMLKEVNVSLGLMLEQLTPKLLTGVHRHAPSKIPQLRLQQLEWAGELKIPFTTGLLLGIGEDEADRCQSLQAIAGLQQKWGHIQEVILQPYSYGENQVLTAASFEIRRLPEVVAIARDILPESITIQIPPNLIREPQLLLDCLAAGARDLGGIGPKDEVNPHYPHLELQRLTEILSLGGWQLVPRLPLYPQYYDWLPLPLKKAVQSLS